MLRLSEEISFCCLFSLAEVSTLMYKITLALLVIQRLENVYSFLLYTHATHPLQGVKVFMIQVVAWLQLALWSSSHFPCEGGLSYPTEEPQKVVLLSSYIYVRHLGCSVLRHVTFPWWSPAPCQHRPFCRLHKGGFCCSKNKSRDANQFSVRFGGWGMNFPEWLCPEDFLSLSLLLDLLVIEEKLYLWTAQDTTLLLWKKGKRREVEKMLCRRKGGENMILPTSAQTRNIVQLFPYSLKAVLARAPFAATWSKVSGEFCL